MRFSKTRTKIVETFEKALNTVGEIDTLGANIAYCLLQAILGDLATDDRSPRSRGPPAPFQKTLFRPKSLNMRLLMCFFLLFFSFFQVSKDHAARVKRPHPLCVTHSKEVRFLYMCVLIFFKAAHFSQARAAGARERRHARRATADSPRRGISSKKTRVGQCPFRVPLSLSQVLATVRGSRSRVARGSVFSRKKSQAENSKHKASREYVNSKLPKGESCVCPKFPFGGPTAREYDFPIFQRW